MKRKPGAGSRKPSPSIPVSETDGGVRIRLLVQPRASRTELLGVQGDAVKIRLAAPPVDGAANEELIRFLASALGLPRRAVTVTQGQTSRRKVVTIVGTSTDAVSRLLLPSR